MNILNNDSIGYLSANSIVHGDCLVEMKRIQDKSVDMILADLPYG